MIKRILLKLSGESLAGDKKNGFESSILEQYAQEIKALVDLGIQVAIVPGGGNIFRGLKGNNFNIERLQGDYMGMLATVINSLALQSALEALDITTKVYSGVAVEPVAEKISGQRVVRSLEKGEVCILAGGTGNPFFTTDSAAALRAIEIKADLLLKGSRVDGIYTADPEKDPTAVRYDKLTFDESYEKQLNIMDLTAFTLCKENNMPVIVFDMNKKGNLFKIIQGENVGTLVLP